MKQSLQVRLGQQLAMTPQLQQAIRLLQLSTLELQSEIQEALESNPMLEVDEGSQEGGAEEGLTSASESANDGESVLEPASSERDEGGDEHGLEEAYSSSEIPDELPVDSHWDDVFEPTPMAADLGGEPQPDLIDTRNSSEEGLREHLLWQINLIPLNELDRAIAETVVDALEEDGYLRTPLPTVAERFLDEGVEIDEIEAVLRLIQQLDPVGVAARDLRECLSLQLGQQPAEPMRDLALVLVKEHLEQMASGDLVAVQKRLDRSRDELLSAWEQVRQLDPRPASGITASSIQYVTPDVFVRRNSGRWEVELNPEVGPRLRVNSTYASFVKRAENSRDNNYMRSQLQEARWFIKSLLSRNETLLRVATAIVERQQKFLEYGEEAMKPLVLRHIAEALEMHESTISRVTTQKYMHTPRGIYELKYFFSSHVGTAEGGECSSTAIRAMIKRLIANENRAKPLSDNKISALLGEQGINVARRTVAKYRDALSIPPSNERKRLA